MRKKFLTNFEEFSLHLSQRRNIDKKRLLLIRNKLTKNGQLTQVINQLRREKNLLSKEKSEKSIILAGSLKKKLDIYEKRFIKQEEELKKLIDWLPNLPNSDVPKENKTIREFKYKHKINHNYTFEQIAKNLNIIDQEASINLSGSKFVVYQGLGSQLIQALINFMLEEQQKRGYKLFTIPYLVKGSNLYNTGQLPKFEEDVFKIENSDLYLIPTAEVPLVNLYQNRIFKEEDLPLKLCSYSPCFRAEAGSAGQENKGLIRLHQFHKVELVRIVKPEDSYHHLEEIVKDARNILDLLEIPYRIIELGTEELGFSSAKTYDIEILLPNGKWLEISSCSNCEDFQTERAMIRVKTKKESKYFPHSLNGSGLAIDRLIIAILGYYYNEKDNSLNVPSVLKKWIP